MRPTSPTHAPRVLAAIVAVLLPWLISAPAQAAPRPADRFSLSFDAGAAARFLDNTALSDPTGFGLSLGLRSELNALIHLRGDLRYLEGRVFDPAEDRYIDGSVAFRTPRLLFVSLDVHEFYARTTSRLGDGLMYINTGVGLGGNILGSSLTAGIGLSYLQAPDTTGTARQSALGMYLGLEWLLRIKIVHVDLRAAAFAALDQATPYFGLLSDGTVTVRLPMGRKGFIGPRFDVAYRNLGLVPDTALLFGQRHEMSAHLGLAIGLRLPKKPFKKAYRDDPVEDTAPPPAPSQDVAPDAPPDDAR